MAGSNSDEATLRKALEMSDDDMFKPLGDHLADVRKIYEADGPLDDKTFANLLFDDKLFAGGAQAFAHAAAKGGQPAYVYHFRYLADLLRSRADGVGHGGEIVYVFGLHGLANNSATALLASLASDKDKNHRRDDAELLEQLRQDWRSERRGGFPYGRKPRRRTADLGDRRQGPRRKRASRKRGWRWCMRCGRRRRGFRRRRRIRLPSRSNSLVIPG